KSGYKPLPAKIGTWEDVDLTELAPEALGPQVTSRRFAMLNGQIRPRKGSGHGTAVSKIIGGRQPYGIALRPSLTVEGGPTRGGRELFAADRAIQKGVKIFQAATSSQNGDVFREFTRAGIISVRSAGNTCPSASPDQAAPEQSILVGELSAVGGISADSSAYPEVTIAAPGEIYSSNGGE